MDDLKTSISHWDPKMQEKAMDLAEKTKKKNKKPFAILNKRQNGVIFGDAGNEVFNILAVAPRGFKSGTLFYL